jgi:hypothetical protein
MADEQTPQTPAPAQPSFFEKLNMPVSQLWSQYRGFLIAAGVLILIVKFREVIIDFLVSSVKTKMDETQKKSDQLKSEQDAANAQADALRQHANDLDKNKTEVGEDWYKK